jgi:hypothetical protein
MKCDNAFLYDWRVKSVALTNDIKRVPEFDVQFLLKSSTVTIRDVYCRGSCQQESAEEFATATEVVFPIAAFMCAILDMTRP